MHMSGFGEFSFETYYFKLVLKNQAVWRMLNLESIYGAGGGGFFTSLKKHP
jgi:hypothetical protein